MATDSTIPRRNDVLFGKGNSINTHHGNEQLRSIVESYKPRFSKSIRFEKKQIARTIVDHIQKFGGRFLIEDFTKGRDKNQKKKGGEKKTAAVAAAAAADGSGSSQSNDQVTDPSILAKVWVEADEQKAIDKVMHRLREKKASASSGKNNQAGEGEKGEVSQSSRERDVVVSRPQATVTSARVPAPAPAPLIGTASQQNEQQAAVATSRLNNVGVGHFSSTWDGILPRASTHINMPLPTNNNREVNATHPALPSNIQGVSQISLKEWIRLTLALSSSTEDYVLSATNLSWMLTKNLIQQTSEQDSTFLGDVVADNVILSVEVASAAMQPRGLSIQSVHINSSELPHQATNWPPIFTHGLCNALGNILLGIFSMGQSMDGNSLTLPTNSLLSFNNPPVQKRSRVTGQSSTSTLERSKGILTALRMPVSVCHLVCDLLDAMNPNNITALKSLEDALENLTQMRDRPQSFLFDRTCSLRAMVDTSLFINADHQLVGREKEIDMLMSAKKRISDHVLMESSNPPGSASVENIGWDTNFQCDLMILDGESGSGKTSLRNTLVRACQDDGWLVIIIQFGKHVAPHAAIANALADFLVKSRPQLQQTINKIFQSIIASVGNEGISQLLELLPSLREAFPRLVLPASNLNNQETGTSSIETIGSADKRRKFLFEMMGQAILSAGLPVLAIYEDIQWSGSFPCELLESFITNQSTNLSGNNKGREGLVFLLTVRGNELGGDHPALKSIKSFQDSKLVKLSWLNIGGLNTSNVSHLLSSKLCVGRRYVMKLASIVSLKTRGNPFHIIQFLKSIIENRMLQFDSTITHQWIFDTDVIDLMIISDEVAQLLTKKLGQLPTPLVQAMKIISCIGYQINRSTIDLLNINSQSQFNMEDMLQMAINEGLIERAGPVYQFTHDTIKETVYASIPADCCKLLHKSIGTCLLQSAANNSSIFSLAVDQINIYCESESLSQEERSSFATINVTAAKYAISASSFEQARSYIDAGTKLLDPINKWQTQYSLSLQLFELSASVSCMHGDTSTMLSCVNEIMDNVKSLEDSLFATSLTVKYLASCSKYDEAISKCLSVLSSLGENISLDSVGLPGVLNELTVIQTTLANISVEQVKALPPMTDKNKLHAMKFLSMLCIYVIYSSPKKFPLLATNMVRITIENGFCDDSIVGLATAAFGLFTVLDDVQLGYRIGKVCDVLIEESPNKNALRSRLCRELDTTLKGFVEPLQTVVPLFYDRYNCAMLAGDIEGATRCFVAYCNGLFYIGENLASLTKKFRICLEKTRKYKQINLSHVVMANFRACLHLTGKSEDEAGIKSYDELEKIGEATKSNLLQWRLLAVQLSNLWYDHDWIKLINLSEKHPPASVGFNRVAASARSLYVGIASLKLAQQTHQSSKYKSIGEDAIKKISKCAELSPWNYQHRLQCLHAEYSYLNGDLEGAEKQYNASIESAIAHKYFNEEAFVRELYGIFCIENKMVEKGVGQLHSSLQKYKDWGAMKKVKDLQKFIDIVDPASLKEL